jgi:glycosyltransferase involved in cell wall biosynthesis
MKSNKLNVVLLAEQCNPEWPSLPIVGYKTCKEIAKIVNVTLVTHIRNKKQIEEEKFQWKNIIYIDNEYIANPIHKLLNFIRGDEGAWTTVQAMYYPTYLAFEWEAWKQLKTKIKAGEYDIIHRITPMSPTLPSPLSKWSKIPFIIGPLNGGLEWPRGFEKELNEEKEWLTKIRNIYKYLPYSKETYKSSSKILTSFKHTYQQIPTKYQTKTVDIPEVGIDPDIFFPRNTPQINTKKKVLFVGRLVPYKMPEVVIQAFINSDILKEHDLIILGDGPLRSYLEAKVEQNNCSDIISFVGWKTQKEVSEYMRNCEIFAFPSIRELGAGVVVEAMACGMASIVIDYGAPGKLVGDDCGIVIELSNREKLQLDFQHGLEKLVNLNGLQILRDNAAKKSKSLYSWEKKAQTYLELYQEVLSNE